jgi:GH25 family lysozyme M1 (1,4-beta-N-acetylmuramidase)
MARNEPFGIDVSRHQGVVNWDAIALRKDDPSTGSGSVRFAGIRAGISWGYVDSFFGRNWQEAKAAGIPRAAYHVFYPNESPERQALHFIKTIREANVAYASAYASADSANRETLGELPPVADVELYSGIHACTPAVYGKNLQEYLGWIEAFGGVRPLIYSRKTMIDKFVTDGKLFEWLSKYDWWLAQYLKDGSEHPGPVALPVGVSEENAIIQQTSDRGAPFGVQSKALDYNRWIGKGKRSLEQYLVNPSEGLGVEISTPESEDLTAEASGIYGDLVEVCQRMNGSLIDLEDIRDQYGKMIGK